MKDRKNQAVLKPSLQCELSLLLDPQQIYSCFKGWWWGFFKSIHLFPRLKGQ